MERANILAAAWLTVSVAIGPSIGNAQERPKALNELVTRLNVSGQGAGGWLAQLGIDSTKPAAERLLVLSVAGGPLAVRTGNRSWVVIDGDLDRLLRTPGTSAILLHNHPSNVGLSAADIGQVSKPGVRAIVAIGHDGSVFVAAPGRAMDPDGLEARQYVRALNEVTRRLRAEWPSVSVPVAVSDAHLNHLVARALAQAGIIQYWSDLRGDTRASYDLAQLAFNRVVAGAAAYLRRVEKPALSAHR